MLRHITCHVTIHVKYIISCHKFLLCTSQFMSYYSYTWHVISHVNSCHMTCHVTCQFISHDMSCHIIPHDSSHAVMIVTGHRSRGTGHRARNTEWWPITIVPWGNRGLKSIGIFTYKQRLLSMDMKTNVVQHIRSIIFKVCKVFYLHHTRACDKRDHRAGSQLTIKTKLN